MLVVDDEPVIVRVVGGQLVARGYEVSEATTTAAALERVTAGGVDAIVLDVVMPDGSGLELLEQLLQLDRSLTIVLLTGAIETAQTVRALRAGAEDVLTKPVDLDVLSAAIDRGLARTLLMRSKRLADIEVRDPYGLLDDSAAMRRVRRTVDALQRSTSPVLIIGERGTGKGAVAQLLHQGSPLAAKPFATVACGARSAAEVERALLSAVSLEAGASAGSGILAKAGGGTLFLSDIEVLAPSTQSLLLALLDERVRARHSWVPSHVRVIASTTRDLGEEVRAGRLRPEVHQHLGVVPLMLPALRDRGPDAIAALAKRIVHRQRVEIAEGPFGVTDAAMQLLVAADWPGNAHQLRLVLEDAFARAVDAEAIAPQHLRGAMERHGLGTPEPTGAEDLTLEAVERAHIAMILRRTGGNRSEAARLLGITRTTLYKKIADYGLEDPRPA